MRKFGKFVLRYGIILMVIIFLATVYFFLHVPNLEIESDMKTWFPESDPAFIKFDRFFENFPQADFILVAYHTDNVFSQGELKYLSNLTDKLKKAPYVSEALSLTTAEDVVVTKQNYIAVDDLIQKTSLSSREIKDIKDRIERNPLLSSNLVSDDYKTVGILLKMDISDADEQRLGRNKIERDITNNIRETLEQEQGQTGKVFHMSGSVLTGNAINEGMGKDISKFLPFAVILMAGSLYFVFRRFLCVVIPLIPVLAALVWTIGLKGAFDSPISPISTTLFTLIIAIGMADGIHFISHYFSEVPRFKEKKDAILETYARAGMPCLMTSLTTAAGFGSLATSNLKIIQHLGIFAGIGIMSAWLLTMIIIPNALLRLNVKPVVSRQRDSKLLYWIALINLKHPKKILAGSIFACAVMLVAIPGIYVEGSILQYLKPDAVLRQDARFLDQNLGGTSSADVVLYGNLNSFKDPEVLKKIDRFQRLVEDRPGVVASYSMADYIKVMDRAFYNDSEEYFLVPATARGVDQILKAYDLSDSDAISKYTSPNYDMARVSIITHQMNRQDRDMLIQEIKGFVDVNFPEFKVDITGFDALIEESTSYIVTTQFRSLGLSIVVIFGMMMLVFGFKGGLVSMFPNIFPLLILLGIMGFAGFTLNIATATIAAIAIGLVVDDTIHYFSHFRHEYRVWGDRKVALLNSMQNVARAMVFTSMTLTLGCLIFLFSQTSILVDFAVLTSLAIIAALLGDLFIAPVMLSRLKVFETKS